MGSQNALKRKLLLRAISRQRGKCHICGGQMSSPKNLSDPLRATADHLLPKSLGGAVKGNIAAAHAKCNIERGNKRLYEIQDRIMRGPPMREGRNSEQVSSSSTGDASPALAGKVVAGSHSPAPRAPIQEESKEIFSRNVRLKNAFEERNE